MIYLGRSDHQVKIRSLRIELGKIKAAIMATELARECVVLARDDRAREKRLVAYLVPTKGFCLGTLAACLAASLPGHMVPAASITLDALPVTSNGKLGRKALPAPEFRAGGRMAETAIEQVLARLFTEVLHLSTPATVEADLFALSGDSLSAVRLILHIEEEPGRDPGLGTEFEHPVLSALAEAIDATARNDGLGPLILLVDGDEDAAPLFLIHPAGGIGWGYRHLARRIAPVRRVWAVQHPGLDTGTALRETLDAQVRFYVGQIATLVPTGPPHQAGWSADGIIAQAIAVELAATGREAGLVAALDNYPADAWRNEPEPDTVAALRALPAIAGHDPEAHRDLDTREKVVDFLRATGTTLGALPGPVLESIVRLVTHTNRLLRGHHHRPMAGRLTHIRAARDHEGTALSARMWQPYVGATETLSVPLLHAQMPSPEASALIGPELARRMARP